MKKLIVFGVIALCAATVCARPHHHRGNKGLHLATDIVNLVGASVNTVAAVVAPTTVVVHTPPPPPHRTVVVHTPPPPPHRTVVVHTPPPPPRRTVVVHTPPPPPRPVVIHRPAPRPVYRPAPPVHQHHGGGHRGGRR